VPKAVDGGELHLEYHTAALDQGNESRRAGGCDRIEIEIRAGRENPLVLLAPNATPIAHRADAAQIAIGVPQRRFITLRCLDPRAQKSPAQAPSLS
jgi:hypothetical protein